jgi:hypothetical protein
MVFYISNSNREFFRSLKNISYLTPVYILPMGIFLTLCLIGSYFWGYNFIFLIIALIVTKLMILLLSKIYSFITKFQTYRLKKIFSVLDQFNNKFPHLFSVVLHAVIIYDYLIDNFLFGRRIVKINYILLFLGSLFWLFFFSLIPPIYCFFILLYTVVIPEFWAITLFAYVRQNPNIVVPPKSIFIRTMWRRAFQFATNEPGKTYILAAGAGIGYLVYQVREYQQHIYTENQNTQRHNVTETQNTVRHTLSEENINRRWASDKLDTPGLSEERKQYYSEIEKTGRFPDKPDNN